MNRITLFALPGALALGVVGCAAAPQVVLPQGVTEDMLVPPPVPHFMLERPAKPLTAAEMLQQVHEAENKVGVGQPN